jgi:hypothetical protein
MVVQSRDDRTVDDLIEAVGHGLVGEEHAESGHDDRAAGQQDSSRPARGPGQQRLAIMQARPGH